MNGSDLALRASHVTACLAPAVALLIWSAIRTDLAEIMRWTLALIWGPYILLVLPKLLVRHELRRRAIAGYLAGMLATAVYTLFRWPAAIAGIIPDVPMILGDHLWGVTDVYWDRCWQSILLGYAVHFLMTGAAWGSAFAMSGLDRFRFGSSVWGCTVGSVFLMSPLFDASLTYVATTIPKLTIGALVFLAHVPYGWVLGKSLRIFEPRRLSTAP